MKQLRALAVATVLIGCGSMPAKAAGGFHEPWSDTGEFVSAPDGDTLKVRTARRGVITVRLAGADTPERGQAYWRAAKGHLVAMVASTDVMLACYKTDRYDREVCRVRTLAGDVGASLIASGLAWHYKRFQMEQTVQEQAQYAQLERIARERRLGLWQEPDPMPPEDCRKAHRSGQKCH